MSTSRIQCHCLHFCFTSICFYTFGSNVSAQEMPNDILFEKRLRLQGALVVCGPHFGNLCIGVNLKVHTVDTPLIHDTESDGNAVDTCLSFPVLLDVRSAVKRRTNISGLRSHLDSNVCSATLGRRQGTSPQSRMTGNMCRMQTYRKYLVSD